jgi:hypothetical protein
MKITKVHNKFYILEDVFSDVLLDKLKSNFDLADSISHRMWQGDFARIEIGSDYTPKALQEEILIEMQPIIEFIETVINSSVYPNNIQFWVDEDGYCNAMHTDHSDNLGVNLQVYLTDGDESMGTSVIIDGETHTAPYRYNCGYILFDPTHIQHGMLGKVNGIRKSIYQSFRTTIQDTSDW